jgi:predicted O-linked N-acetylglucosamine transferase (SPINDLY family)
MSAECFAAWLAYYERERIEALSNGWITLRKASGRPNWFRCDDAPELVPPCGESITRGFEARDFLERASRDETLLEARLRVAPEVCYEEECQPSSPGWTTTARRLRITHGLACAGEVNADLAGLVGRCDGDRPLRVLLDDLAATLGRPMAEMAPACLQVVRRIIEQGFLLPPTGLREAITRFQEALSATPEDAALHRGLGAAWHELGEYGLAAASLRQALAIAPDCGEAHQSLGKALFELGQADDALEAFRKTSALLGPSERTLGNMAVLIPGCPHADNQAILEVRRAWAAHQAATAPTVRPHARPRRGGKRRLRIGYVSSFLHHRNWMKPVWGLLRRHDRQQFEVHLFSDAPESSIEHGYCKHARDRHHDISGLSNTQVADMIAEQEIDLLIDLNGYSELSRLSLFALRPAPIIISWFNQFATTGMNCFDYLIGDECVILPEEEAFYTESLVRIPGCYLPFEVTYPVPDVTAPPCPARKYVTFGCLAPQYKITTQVVEAWSRILRNTPGSRLVLRNVAIGMPSNRQFVHELFGKFSVAPERVQLLGPAEHYEFLQTYAEMDIALDTFPYNGGTTTAEALWQGVPVVCFVGDRWASRISATLLRNAGLAECIALDLDGYVKRATELAIAPGRDAQLQVMRQTMRERLGSAPVCDLDRFTQEMERTYFGLWRRWHDGSHPRTGARLVGQ